MSVYADKTYRKRQAALKRASQRENLTCWLCGKPFDWTIENYLHPQAFTADHVEAIGNGGRLLGELRPAHRGCNSRRGKRRTPEQIQPPQTTRRW